MSNEFDDWAKRFEAQPADDYRRMEAQPARCMYAVREGPHKTACNETAISRSNGYPVCRRHISRDVRSSWRGYMEGA